MKIKKEALRLYAVTDRRWLKTRETLRSSVEELLKAGVTCVQLREKEAGEELLLQEAEELQALCAYYGVPLIINDYPGIAKKVKASGVHVGLSDMEVEGVRKCLGEEFIIGASAHNVREAREAEAAGADYIGCGAVFGSSTKRNVTVLAKEELKRICQAVEIPVVAIGGITLKNVRQLAGTGIAGVAVVSALFSPEAKERAVREFLKSGFDFLKDDAGKEVQDENGIDHCRK